jgi:hypothetical protein
MAHPSAERLALRAMRHQKSDGSTVSHRTALGKIAKKITLQHTIPAKKSAPGPTPELNPM